MSSLVLICNSSTSLINNAYQIKREDESLEFDIIHLEHSLFQTILPKIRDKTIIALPIMAKRIRKEITNSVITLHPSSLNLLEAFTNAKTISQQNIAYIGFNFPTLHEDIVFIQKYLNIKVDLYCYEDKENQQHVINNALQNNINAAVVTSEIVENQIRDKVIKTVLVEVGKFAILQAIRTGLEIIKSKEIEHKKNRWLQSLMDLTNDGVISTDLNGAITTFNQKAGEYLSVRPDEMVGANYNDLPDNDVTRDLILETKKLLQTSEYNEERSHFLNLANKNFLVNTAIINKKDEEGQVIITFRDESEIRKYQNAIYREAVNKGMTAKYLFKDIIGKEESIVSAIEIAKNYARSDSTILITGETGVGKEVFAQSIHNFSKRKNGPFVAINCANIPDNLLESELFGYERGSFTGAKREGKKGLFELANTGTVFLDEISEMSLSLQAGLLRVLQNKEIRQIGGDKAIPVDIRIIAATNKDMTTAIDDKSFREDLYYRINILNLYIPPLRKRKKDIRLLAEYFLREKSSNSLNDLPEALINAMGSYHWPGNVRQLEGFIEKFIVLYNMQSLQLLTNKLIQEIRREDPKRNNGISENLEELLIAAGSLENLERQLLLNMLPKYGIVYLADLLGVSRTTLWRKLKKWSCV